MARDKSGKGPPQAPTAVSQTRSKVPTSFVTRYGFSGPIPPPDLIRQYEEIRPGSSDLFFSSWQEQSEHRRSLETKVIGAGIVTERLGTILAFIFAAFIVGCGTYLVSIDKDALGFAAIVGAIATPASLFVYSKRQDKKELQAKDPGNA